MICLTSRVLISGILRVSPSCSSLCFDARASVYVNSLSLLATLLVLRTRLFVVSDFLLVHAKILDLFVLLRRKFLKKNGINGRNHPNSCELYGRIARTFENLKKLGQANITASAVQTRLANLKKCWTTFKRHARLCTKFRDAVKTHDYIKKDYLSLTEEVYLTSNIELLGYLSRLQSSAPVSAPSTSNQSDMPRTNLPRIQLPQFSGKYENWPSFQLLPIHF